MRWHKRALHKWHKWTHKCAFCQCIECMLQTLVVLFLGSPNQYEFSEWFSCHVLIGFGGQKKHQLLIHEVIHNEPSALRVDASTFNVLAFCLGLQRGFLLFLYHVSLHECLLYLTLNSLRSSLQHHHLWFAHRNYSVNVLWVQIWLSESDFTDAFWYAVFMPNMQCPGRI